MPTRWIILGSLMLGLSAGLQASPFTIYVAPDGRDAWSGRLPAPAPDGSDGPLASLPAALRTARVARQDTNLTADGVTILLRGGTYELSEPLRLTPGDSGADSSRPTLLAAFPDETPVLSGGGRITGWSPVESQPGLWQARVAVTAEGQGVFRSLFADGRRLQRARTPNEGYFRIQGESPQDQPVKLKFKAGDIQPAWTEPGDVEVVAYLAWADIRMQIRAVDSGTNIATLSGNPQPSNRENDAQYFIENAPDALDVPGEWYLDRRKATVFYLAQPGENPNRMEMIAPTLRELLVVQGDWEARQPVRHITLRGLTFAYTDWTLGEKGYADTQAAFGVAGNVRAEAAEACAIESCRFEHLAGYAIELGRGCKRWRVVGNELFDLGAGGVRLGEPDVRPDPFDANNGHVITDNHIHSLGRVYAPAIGVLVLQSGMNQVAHNHVHDLYYTAISVGWTWGYQDSPCHHNVIEYNHLHDIGQARLSDMGAIYTLGPQTGTIIRNNLIHDVDAFTYGGWGLYTDEGSTGILLENNVVYRTKSAGFHQHYGRDNVIRNNIFAFGREHQVMRSRAEEHNSFSFDHNIVLFDSGDLLGSNWSADRYRMDYNVYWDARPGFEAGSLKLDGGTLAQWRARGHDIHSVVADPGFTNPGDGGFQLKSGSPALSLNFWPIDFSQVGVRKLHKAQVRDTDPL